ncbi:hypothetical protein OCU04_009769 [Sclerotinia nivalis]|uniref:Uncharacterized protein n=1 Tax=Sclerotinia nivalis TaxID=352851 RepID=A0A9X0AFR4_9HELO|nr:hypothetical protein OCU04_009769 [Sclerotinia nivalis]
MRFYTFAIIHPQKSDIQILTYKFINVQSAITQSVPQVLEQGSFLVIPSTISQEQRNEIFSRNFHFICYSLLYNLSAINKLISGYLSFIYRTARESCWVK